ncbi:MAG: tetratricopeptide repeat protein, partial [Verrucomicrobiae bacterium]|nr:tetratricopeptide repeat protein [Verrucomicrobiae bacterium]
RAMAGVLAAVVLVACGVATRAQLAHWKDSVTLFERALAAGPPSAVMHLNLGKTLLDRRLPAAATQILSDMHGILAKRLHGRGDTARAKAHFEAALRIKPDHALAHSNLGIVLAEEGRLEDAIAHFKEALRIKPGLAEAHHNLGVVLLRAGKLQEAEASFAKAIECKPFHAEAHYALGNLRLQRGQFAEAAEHFQMALRVRPHDAEAHNRLGIALARQGRPHDALTHFRRALELGADPVQTHHNLGNAFSMQGRLAEAIAEYRTVVRLNPNHLEALNNLAWYLATARDATLRDGAEAVRLAEHGVELTGGNDPNLLGVLAAAYAEAGQFEQAVQTARRALALAEAGADPALANQLRARIQLYESRQPYRE